MGLSSEQRKGLLLHRKPSIVRFSLSMDKNKGGPVAEK
ncbi:hypothetical protein EDC40_11369 [Aminobacter aminovorans]|uniref:Uncharacterized protein n=1 Tax=Aminobacter aminovorans TaxID=83263 RepID=A0A380WFR5_AMIAI|nr:hypothetical protein EDC40_11369 [Aminobacter aminovorans]SUU87605.1 Uncharacterised protein [Aminobacter aminovorans]